MKKFPPSEHPLIIRHYLELKDSSGVPAIPLMPNPDNAAGVWPQCSLFWNATQVGLLEGFESDDPVFPTSNGAKHYARVQSEKTSNDFYVPAWGVWDVETGELMSIFYQGNEYS